MKKKSSVTVLSCWGAICHIQPCPCSNRFMLGTDFSNECLLLLWDVAPCGLTVTEFREYVKFLHCQDQKVQSGSSSPDDVGTHWPTSRHGLCSTRPRSSATPTVVRTSILAVGQHSYFRSPTFTLLSCEDVCQTKEDKSYKVKQPTTCTSVFCF